MRLEFLPHLAKERGRRATGIYRIQTRPHPEWRPRTYEAVPEERNMTNPASPSAPARGLSGGYLNCLHANVLTAGSSVELLLVRQVRASNASGAKVS